MRKRGKYEKYGKYEKRPEGASEKQPQTKNMLLQAYFTGLLSLVLCVTMFFSTSYAWFTNEVSNTGNEIYVGTLDVGLFNGDKNLASSDNNAEKLFDSNIRWEPGRTEFRTITVKNRGNLDFDYVLSFTEDISAPETAVTPAAGETAAPVQAEDCFEVWVYAGTADDAARTYEKMNEDNGWEKVGSLTELLKGKPVLQGELAAAQDGSSEAANAVATEHTYTIALHMKETVDASAMGKRITFNVKLVAYQTGYIPTTDGTANEEGADA